MGISAIAARAIMALRNAFVKGFISERQLERREARIIERDEAGRPDRPERYGRPAAPSSGSRQNERRKYIARAFRGLSVEFAGELRSVRRRMARGMGKHAWRTRHGLERAHA